MRFWHVGIPIAIIASLFAYFFLGSVQAAPLCRPHDQIVKILADNFAERLHGIGLTARNQLPLEIYVSDTGSWTVIVTTPNNVACVWAFGEKWITVEPASPAGDI